MKFLSYFKQNPFARERILGVARETRRYDLPLSATGENSFLRLLIALMSILGILALSASFALSAMTERWQQGLANKMTVEIPASDSAGEALPSSTVKSMTNDAAKFLKESRDVIEAIIMEESHVKKLLSPWLGEDMVMDSIPIPGIISVTFDKNSKPDLEKLQSDLANIAPRARLDTHQGWLNDVARFTGALQFAAILLGVIIGFTTLVAVAGGVRSKLSENKEELELLHLMGATDSYIAKQLQRHTMILSLQGGIIGMVCGIILLIIIGMVAGEMGVNLIPDFKLTALQKSMLILLPIPIAALAMVTARTTVMSVLTKLP
jgi:cell division transport system permease protein